MAVEDVKLNAGDNKSEVAYKMALGMWHQSNDHRDPSLTDQKEFLKLVEDCNYALK